MVQALHVVIQVLIFFVIEGLTLKCYECDNIANPACGEYFKAYQFQAKNCPRSNDKCGLQRQPPEDGWIGIIRDCYSLGSLPGLSEVNGCHNWTSSDGSYFYVCFCDTDYCNGSSYAVLNIWWALLVFLAKLAVM